MPVEIPGLGLIIAFVALTLLGFLTANLIGRKLVDFGEGILNRMPIVRPIYRTAKQIFQTLFSKSESSFRRVGLVEFPSPGMWSLVFSPSRPDEEISGRLAGDRACLGLHAVHAQSDHRIFLLRAAARRDRSRHYGRSGDDAVDVGGHRAAGRRIPIVWIAGEARRARRNRARRADSAQGRADAPRNNVGVSRRRSCGPPRRARTDRAIAATPRPRGDRSFGSRASTSCASSRAAGNRSACTSIRAIAEARHAALPHAEHVACAAQPQILLGDDEAVVGSRKIASRALAVSPSGAL